MVEEIYLKDLSLPLIPGSEDFLLYIAYAVLALG